MKRLKKRLTRQMFWIGLVSLVLMLIDNVLVSYFHIDISRTLNQIEETVCIIVSILVFMGILSSRPDIDVKALRPKNELGFRSKADNSKS